MKKIFMLIICVIVMIPIVTAQNPEVEYVYDLAGNREIRRIIYLKTDDPNKNVEASLEDLEEQKINDIISDHSLSIYPNPTKGVIAIEINDLDPLVKGKIGIYDTEGKLVGEDQNLQSFSQFDLSERSAGVYFLRIQAGEEIKNMKIIKQ